MTESPTAMPMTAVARALRARALSPLELVDAYLARIDAAPELRAFITPPGAAARRQVQRAAERIARRETGALLGLPIAIKNLFATRGVRTTVGSKILRDWQPGADAAVVTRLRKAGAIVFGKTNLHEFAYGVSNANPWWGVARNPVDPRRSPGGSSGGSAIAVVAGMCAAALGSDTGGSIRIPAALCGCVGLKPTRGAVPLQGAFPLGWSLDHAGSLTRTVADASLRVQILPGRPAPSPITAPVIGERVVRWRAAEEPIDGALVRLTSPFNLSGLPALSVPCGEAGGLPVGVQVVGRWNDEPRVLAVGQVIEEFAQE